MKSVLTVFATAAAALLGLPGLLAAPSPAGSAQARILGKIPDGTPPPPEPPKPTFNLPQKQVAAEKTVAEGGRTVTIRKVAPLFTVVPVAAVAPEPVPDAEALRARLEELRAARPVPLLVGIGASVLRAADGRVVSRVTCRILSGEGESTTQAFWSSADFSLLAGLHQFAGADNRTYSLMMAWSVSDEAPSNALRAKHGLPPLARPSVELPSGPATFVADGPPASPEASAALRALHEIYNRDYQVLLAARDGREAAHAAHEAWLEGASAAAGGHRAQRMGSG